VSNAVVDEHSIDKPSVSQMQPVRTNVGVEDEEIELTGRTMKEGES
jgi:hypothetical protein